MPITVKPKKILNARGYEAQHLDRFGRKITSPQPKGTVPFLLRKNWDRPQVIFQPIPSKAMIAWFPVRNAHSSERGCPAHAPGFSTLECFSGKMSGEIFSDGDVRIVKHVVFDDAGLGDFQQQGRLDAEKAVVF
jgi:hypothetical protein